MQISQIPPKMVPLRHKFQVKSNTSVQYFKSTSITVACNGMYSGLILNFLYGYDKIKKNNKKTTVTVKNDACFHFASIVPTPQVLPA